MSEELGEVKVLQGSEKIRESSTPSSSTGVYKLEQETATGDKGALDVSKSCCLSA